MKRSFRAIDSNDQDKVCILLFACASTRALHLELVENMLAAICLQAFRRFSRRRGLPKKVLTNNAKNFKAASKKVRNIEGRELLFCKSKNNVGVRHKESFLARMILGEDGACNVKCCLKIGALSFGKLQILLVEIETNRRTGCISYGLTPSHLVYERQIASEPNDKPYEIVSTEQSLTKRAKYHRRILNKLFKTTKYLLSLRESSKSTRLKGGLPITAGDMVICKKKTPDVRSGN